MSGTVAAVALVSGILSSVQPHARGVSLLPGRAKRKNWSPYDDEYAEESALLAVNAPATPKEIQTWLEKNEPNANLSDSLATRRARRNIENWCLATPARPTKNRKIGEPGHDSAAASFARDTPSQALPRPRPTLAEVHRSPQALSGPDPSQGYADAPEDWLCSGYRHRSISLEPCLDLTWGKVGTHYRELDQVVACAALADADLLSG
jgi:hypothetical protein